ncbi:MAG: hypothetical protein PF541_10205 [Prolixibacteraceae bacterium]|jgi:hypothetical protein|nr:hypothetical protein [Prolixibacteraceae bacterium]
MNIFALFDDTKKTFSEAKEIVLELKSIEEEIIKSFDEYQKGIEQALNKITLLPSSMADINYLYLISAVYLSKWIDYDRILIKYPIIRDRIFNEIPDLSERVFYYILRHNLSASFHTFEKEGVDSYKINFIQSQIETVEQFLSQSGFELLSTIDQGIYKIFDSMYDFISIPLIEACTEKGFKNKLQKKFGVDSRTLKENYHLYKNNLLLNIDRRRGRLIFNKHKTIGDSMRMFQNGSTLYNVKSRCFYMPLIKAALKYQMNLNEIKSNPKARLTEFCLKDYEIKTGKKLDNPFYLELLNDNLNPSSRVTKEDDLNSFGLLNNNQETVNKLKNIINALNLNIKLLKETDTDSFLEVLIAPDFSILDKKIMIGCQTNEFKYVCYKLSKYFQNFSYLTIGNTGLFFSRSGKVLTRTNLANSNFDVILSKDKIDKIFN